ncbi:hypothetical protein HanRHA438_Chr12g0569571 [Helianthus annuus]|nr:hypothetical protein HanRHA438_Chr12g0569571 [Helianthus annuus]
MTMLVHNLCLKSGPNLDANLRATEFADDNVVATPGIQMVEVTAPASTKITLKLLQQFLYFVNILQRKLIRTTKVIKGTNEELQKPSEDGNALVYPFAVVMNKEFDRHVRLYSKGFAKR